jgi:hypothetical protein
MGMQADPTVIFALQRAGKWDGNLSRDDLQFDSPYNTYRYGGLPPGPIAAPGRRALEAVVSPAKVDYLYFVSRNDGTHVFATTLAEHNRNVFEWQVKFFRDRRARDGRGADNHPGWRGGVARPCRLRRPARSRDVVHERRLGASSRNRALTWRGGACASPPRRLGHRGMARSWRSMARPPTAALDCDQAPRRRRHADGHRSVGAAAQAARSASANRRRSRGRARRRSRWP